VKNPINRNKKWRNTSTSREDAYFSYFNFVQIKKWEDNGRLKGHTPSNPKKGSKWTNHMKLKININKIEKFQQQPSKYFQNLKIIVKNCEAYFFWVCVSVARSTV
jgi:hypothetical protein